MDNLWIWLVVGQTPLKNMSSSIGMMKIPICGKMKKKTKTPTSDGCVQPEPQSLLTVVMLVWLVVYLPEKHAWAHTVGWEYYEKICEE